MARSSIQQKTFIDLDFKLPPPLFHQRRPSPFKLTDRSPEITYSVLFSLFLCAVSLDCSLARSVNGQDLTRESFSGPVAPVTRQLANNGKMDGPDLEIIQTEASTQ